MNTYHVYPGIVVLNKNYFPDNSLDAYTVGATSIALETIKCLVKNKLLLGVILYERDQTISSPHILESGNREYQVLIIKFNFEMPQEQIEGVFKKAFESLAPQKTESTIVYYQTDVFLQYHPKEVPCCVTHHGPFVEDFADHYTLNEAYYAFGGFSKAMHLLKHQYGGIKPLVKEVNYFVLQHSALQANFLKSRGVSSDTIYQFTPPIAPKFNLKTIYRKEISTFIENTNHNTLIITSCVARIDYFKKPRFIS
jgi:hypothetical protein